MVYSFLFPLHISLLWVPPFIVSDSASFFYSSLPKYWTIPYYLISYCLITAPLGLYKNRVYTKAPWGPGTLRSACSNQSVLAQLRNNVASGLYTFINLFLYLTQLDDFPYFVHFLHQEVSRVCHLSLFLFIFLFIDSCLYVSLSFYCIYIICYPLLLCILPFSDIYLPIGIYMYSTSSPIIQ